jgi:hypothetical protein
MDASVIESYLSGLNRFQGQCAILDSLYQQHVKHIYLYFVNQAYLEDPTRDYTNYRYHNFCFEIVKIKKIINNDAHAGHTDIGHTDAGHTDAGHTDVGHTDAGHTDAGHTDVGHTDAGHTDDNNCYLIKLKFVFVRNLDRIFYIDMRVDRSLLPIDNKKDNVKVVARYHERINNHRTSVATDHISHEYSKDNFFSAIRYHLNLAAFQ